MAGILWQVSVGRVLSNTPCQTSPAKLALPISPLPPRLAKANLALPMFSFGGRSPYSWMDDEYFEDSSSHKPLKIIASYIGGGEMQSWSQSQSLDFDLSYYYNISEKWSLGMSYWFSLNTNQNPKPFTSIENIALIGFKLKF